MTGFAGEHPFSSLLPESEVVSRILLPPASPVFIHTCKTVGSVSSISFLITALAILLQMIGDRLSNPIVRHRS